MTHALEAALRQAIVSTAELYLLRGKAYDMLGEFEHAHSDFEHALEGIRAGG